LEGAVTKAGDPKISLGQEKYFKQVLKFRGVKTPQLDKIFKEYTDKIKELDVEDAIELATNFLSSKYGEDKQIGVNILKSRLKSLEKSHLKHFEKIFDTHVYDWGTCDGFSSKVLCEMIKIDKSVAKEVHQWQHSECIWRKRASCVSFVKIARFGKFNKEIIEICSTCVKSNERFVQLGVGWVLRELSLTDLGLVEKFIKKNYHHFSREGLRYAVEKMTNKKKTELMQYNSQGGHADEIESEEEEDEEENKEDDEDDDEDEEEEELVEKKRRKSSRIAKGKKVAKR